MTFIKKHKALSLILFLGPIIITAILRIFDWRSSICITASDWITLLAGLFTYYGTVILAVVTVSQNDKLIDFQERQERREQLQDEREERQERREERQEERDKLQQEIARRQLEISEGQKEIADRQLQYVEREQEITEAVLIEENQPNFEIFSIRNGNEEPIKLERQSYIRGYDHEFKSRIDKESNTIYITFVNKSKTDAYDVSLVEVEPKFWFDVDEEEKHYKDIVVRRNESYKKLYVTTFEYIPRGDARIMSFVLSDDENDIVIYYTLTFRNIYQQWFYQDVVVCMGREDDKIELQLQINDSKSGERDIKEHGFVKYRDGKALQFPTSK